MTARRAGLIKENGINRKDSGAQEGNGNGAAPKNGQ
jgi:hypothetical protein